MQNQNDGKFSTDLGTFLYEIANKLGKEGNTLRSLAQTWFGDGNEDFLVARQIGIDICDLGNQVQEIKKQLCTNCKMKPVAAVLNFEGSAAKEKKESGL